MSCKCRMFRVLFQVIISVVLVAETTLLLAAFIWLAFLTFSDRQIPSVKSEVNGTSTKLPGKLTEIFDMV